MKIINHEVNGLQVSQRRLDGYINATQMCKANNKEWYQYWRLPSTQEYANALANDLGIALIVNNPNRKNYASALVLTFRGGNSQQGTWVHPEVAVDLAAWISVEFRILVNRWIREWMSTGLNPIAAAPNTPTDLLAEINKLEKLIISIRSQARTFHTGSHQPADDHLVKSLHSISHNQLNIINSAIQRLQRLKRVAEMNSELEINADINQDYPLNPVTEIPATAKEPNQQPSTNSTMTDITAANFIDSIPIVTKEATVRFTVDLPESMHRDLSILAAKRGVSKADIVRLLLDDALKDIDD